MRRDPRVKIARHPWVNIARRRDVNIARHPWVNIAPHRAVKIAALPLALLAVGACGSDNAPDPSSTSTGPAQSVSTTTPAATESTGTATPSQPTTSSAPGTSAPATSAPVEGACTAVGTRLQVGSTTAAAGSVFYTIKVTNTGTAECTTHGYPGVSLVAAGGGAQIGAAATRDTTVSATTVRLPAGGSTSFVVKVGQAGNYDPAECTPTAAAALRVYLPGDTGSQSVPLAKATGCAATSIDLLQVRPMGAATG